MRQPAALLPLLCLLCSTALAQARTTPHDALGPAVCRARLDAAVQLADGGDAGLARLRLERLAERCARLPQIHHDLGVLAAREGRLPAAFAHFERALAAAPRARMTVEHLRALHRREAALGYARALGTDVSVPVPRLRLQGSTDADEETLAEGGERARLRDVATLEHELEAWWTSAGADADARRAHYVTGHPAELALADRERDARLAWEEVRRDIAFTSEDAVAVLEQADGAGTLRRLVLLRLEGDRWKIYRDTPL